MTSLDEIFDLRGVLSLFVLIVLIFFTLIRNFFRKDPCEFWTPLTFISLVYLYYTVAGPLFLIIYGDTTYRGVELGGSISVAWLGAAISLLCINLGFLLKPLKVFQHRTVDIGKLKKPALMLFITALVLYVSWMGPRVNNFFLILITNQEATYDEMYGGTFSMYLMQGIAFFVPVCCFLLILYIKQKKKVDAILFFTIFALTLIAFLISAFRFRIVMLVISVASVYYIVKSVRLKLLPWVFGGMLFVLVMGMIEQTRSYESGLDLSKTEGLSLMDYVVLGTNETRVFFATGALMNVVAERDLYIGFRPVLTAFLMPIPRALYPEKPDASYLTDMNNAIFGSAGNGVAVLAYGEAFQAFGWLGIIISGLFFGYLSKLFYHQYNKNKNSYYSIVLMALYNAFTYWFISRGYLAQATMTFFFYALIPMWLFLFFQKLAYKRLITYTEG